MSVTHLSSLPYCECGRKKRVRTDVALCEACVALKDYREGKYFVKRPRPELTYVSGGPRNYSKSIGSRSGPDQWLVPVEGISLGKEGTEDSVRGGEVGEVFSVAAFLERLRVDRSRGLHPSGYSEN